ncbi:Aste57867_23779 [Aphanomyces stellatus]|uniref:Aste57867_23779 protein n=1 Tax=Aphanomyces stellatus TaxID=120398 RepID=A0A485LNX1_9STRA|nr:hypothetical protein As57867_023706 [Aphanomyces stellatus]VFU00424.1 Aste57867_23779 [Aphanomyces stellatus]
MKLFVVASTVAVVTCAASAQHSGNCAENWSQCDGQNWSDAACCKSDGWICVPIDATWSQCQPPSSTSSYPTPAPTTTATTDAPTSSPTDTPAPTDTPTNTPCHTDAPTTTTVTDAPPTASPITPSPSDPSTPAPTDTPTDTPAPFVNASTTPAPTNTSSVVLFLASNSASGSSTTSLWAYVVTGAALLTLGMAGVVAYTRRPKHEERKRLLQV